MRSIYQFVAGFRSGDAISNAALMMRDVFRKWGCRTEILVRPSTVSVDRKAEARDIYEAVPKITPDDIAVLHLSIGNPVNLIFRDLKCRKVIVYHNVTPSCWIHRWPPNWKRGAAMSRCSPGRLRSTSRTVPTTPPN